MAELGHPFSAQTSLLLSASQAPCFPDRLVPTRCSAEALGCGRNCCSGSFHPSILSSHRNPSTVDLPGPLTCPASTCPQHQTTDVQELRRKAQGGPGFPCSQMCTEPAQPRVVCQGELDSRYPRAFPMITGASAAEALRI